MLHEVIIGKEKLADVASKYHRSIGHISNLVKAFKKNSELLHELIERRDQQLLKQ